MLGKTGVSKDGFSHLFPVPMTGMLPVLRDMFPGKAMLSVENVALVLGRTGAGAYEQTREQLASGVIVPGLRKVGGGWLVPITALAAALDGLVEIDDRRQARPLPMRHAVISANPVVERPRRGRIPDRLKAQRQRALEFWPAVLAHVQADSLEQSWRSIELGTSEPTQL